MPERLERCVKHVEKQSPKVDNPWAVCKSVIKSSDDTKTLGNTSLQLNKDALFKFLRRLK